MRRRLLRQPEPDAVVEFETGVVVTVTVTEASAVVLDGVPLPQPVRRLGRTFEWWRNRRLDDLTDVPRASQDAAEAVGRVLAALAVVLAEGGGLEAVQEAGQIEPVPMSGTPNEREVAS
jgi:hypothetical protein